MASVETGKPESGNGRAQTLAGGSVFLIIVGIMFFGELLNAGQASEQTSSNRQHVIDQTFYNRLIWQKNLEEVNQMKRFLAVLTVAVFMAVSAGPLWAVVNFAGNPRAEFSRESYDIFRIKNIELTIGDEKQFWCADWGLDLNSYNFTIIGLAAQEDLNCSLGDRVTERGFIDLPPGSPQYSIKLEEQEWIATIQPKNCKLHNLMLDN